MARTLLSACLMAAALTATMSWSQDIDRFMLTEEDFRSLPPEAQQEYLGGTDSLNHVDFLEAHAHYRRAAELAPDSAPMQFKLFELSQFQSRLAAGERRQEDFLVVAREALERVLNSPLSTAEQQRRAETQIQFLTNRLQGIEVEEAGRREMGRSFLHALSLEQDWYRVGQRFPTMGRSIMTASGAGDAVTRSEVVLFDSTGRLYHADMTPYMDENGRHLTRDEMTDYAFEDEPTGAFMRGEPAPATASAAPLPDETSAIPQDMESAPEAPEPTDSEEPSAFPEATESEPAETGGSLSPAVLPEAAALDEGGLTDEEIASSDALPAIEEAPTSTDEFFDSSATPAAAPASPDALAAALPPAEPPPAPPVEGAAVAPPPVDEIPVPPEDGAAPAPPAPAAPAPPAGNTPDAFDF